MLTATDILKDNDLLAIVYLIGLLLTISTILFILSMVKKEL